MAAEKFHIPSSHKSETPKLFGPDAQMEMRPWITSHPIALVIAAGFGAILWIQVPQFRPFLIGSVAVGCVIGAVLWWKHR